MSKICCPNWIEVNAKMLGVLKTKQKKTKQTNQNNPKFNIGCCSHVSIPLDPYKARNRHQDDCFSSQKLRFTSSRLLCHWDLSRPVPIQPQTLLLTPSCFSICIKYFTHTHWTDITIKVTLLSQSPKFLQSASWRFLSPSIPTNTQARTQSFMQWYILTYHWLDCTGHF